jgi:hypothetical protein
MAMSMKAQTALVDNQANRVPIERRYRNDKFGTQTYTDTGRRKRSIVKETRT